MSFENMITAYQHVAFVICISEASVRLRSGSFLLVFRNAASQDGVLCCASLEQHAEIVQLLSDRGVNMDFKDQVRCEGELLVCKDGDGIG